MHELQSEFDKLLHHHVEDSGISKDDIDEELADAKERMAKLRKKGRHDTRLGKALQSRINDLGRLVELRDLLRVDMP